MIMGCLVNGPLTILGYLAFQVVWSTSSDPGYWVYSPYSEGEEWDDIPDQIEKTRLGTTNSAGPMTKAH